MDKGTLTALLGVVIGGALTIASNLLLERYRRRAKAEQLAHAIAGEVLAVMQIVEARGYLNSVKEMAELARRGIANQFKVTIRQTYFSTIEANLDSIGLLPGELPILIPRFLIFGKAIIDDFESLTDLFASATDGRELAARYEQLAFLLEGAQQTGERIVALVATFYGSPHSRQGG